MNIYIPKQFKESSVEVIHELNRVHPFATLVPNEIKAQSSVKAAIEISFSAANSKES